MAKISILAGVALAFALVAGTSFAGEQLSYQVTDSGIETSLTGKSGDPSAGTKVMINRKLGNCLACHKVSALSDQPFHGEVGPSLDGAADRWTEAQLRLIVVDAKKLFPDTIMPSFLTTEGRNRVMKKFKGKTILTPEQAEDVVAFLKTLKE